VLANSRLILSFLLKIFPNPQTNHKRMTRAKKKSEQMNQLPAMPLAFSTGDQHDANNSADVKVLAGTLENIFGSAGTLENIFGSALGKALDNSAPTRHQGQNTHNSVPYSNGVPNEVVLAVATRVQQELASAKDYQHDDLLIDLDTKIPAGGVQGTPTNNCNDCKNSKINNSNSSTKASSIPNHDLHIVLDTDAGVALVSFQKKAGVTPTRKRSTVAKHDGGANATGTKKKSRIGTSTHTRVGEPLLDEAAVSMEDDIPSKWSSKVIMPANSAPPKLANHSASAQFFTPKKQRSSPRMHQSVGLPLKLNDFAERYASPTLEAPNRRLLPSTHIPLTKLAQWKRCLENTETLDDPAKLAGLEAVDEVILLRQQQKQLQGKCDRRERSLALMEQDRNSQHALLKKTGSFLEATRVELEMTRSELATTRTELDMTRVELDVALGQLHR
jgi:hypothetical protein